MFKLAIVGATGLVGQSVMKVLHQQNLLNQFSPVLIASKKSAGKRIVFNGIEYGVVALDENCLKMKFDFVIFSAGAGISKQWAEKFVDSGAVVIDNTSAFRMCEKTPLVVPEINGDTILPSHKLISNPNCSTIQLAVVLDRLLKCCQIEKVVVSTYQSVSGAGRRALLDLINDTKNYFKNGIKNKIIPAIGEIDSNGFCEEENKIMFELSKILNQNISVCATAVRVPVPYCHGESVYVEFENDVDLNKLKQALNCEYIDVCDDLVCVENCVCQHKTYVCRLRLVSKNEALMFVVADNLFRGAAFNAVEIMKLAAKLK